MVGALDAAGIEIPFPDGTLTFKEPLSLAAAHASRPAQRRAGENGPPA